MAVPRYLRRIYSGPEHSSGRRRGTAILLGIERSGTSRMSDARWQKGTAGRNDHQSNGTAWTCKASLCAVNGRAWSMERVCRSVCIGVIAVYKKKKQLTI